MIRRIVISLVALAVVVALAVGAAMLTPARRPAPVAIELPQSSRVICPVAGQALIGPAEGLSVQPLGGEAEETTEQVLALDGPAVLRADSLLAAGVLVDATQRAHVPCASATTSGMVLVPDPGASELIIVNGDANEASVDLTILGPAGEVVAVGARGIELAPGTSRRVALSVLAPEGPVGVAFRASEGRVSLLAAAVEGRPTRFAASTTAAPIHTIAGIPAGATGATLVISNPHETRMDISVEAFGASATYEPATATGISVPPMTTLSVDLGEALAGEASGLRVSADEAIGVGVSTVVGQGSPAMLTSSVESDHLALTAPAAGQLVVTNPGDQVADVTVTTTVVGGEATTHEISVPAGTTGTVALPEGDAPVSVDLASSVPVVAAATSSSDTGTVVVQGVQSTLAPAVGAPAHVDPVLQ